MRYEQLYRLLTDMWLPTGLRWRQQFMATTSAVLKLMPIRHVRIGADAVTTGTASGGIFY